jgi:hypothetical protein
MVGIIPLNLISQETNQVCHTRTRRRHRRPGRTWRGEARQAGRRRPQLHVRPFSFSFPSAACETLLLQLPFRGRLRRGERLSLGTREQNTFRITVQSLLRVFPSRNSARTKEREGMCLRSPCHSRPCTGDRQLGFWGAST